MRRLVLLLVVLTAGCGSTTKVQLECPSPDGMLMAVLFYHSGGGAAGWVQHQITLQPGDRSPIVPKMAFSKSVSLLTIEEAGYVTID
jgi:hypothetical protein